MPAGTGSRTVRRYDQSGFSLSVRYADQRGVIPNIMAMRDEMQTIHRLSSV
jgi:hypothetical protein